MTIKYIPSPNFSQRTGSVSKICIHHAAGRVSADRLGLEFAKPERQASATYGIGYDGEIAAFLPENVRPWTSGPSANDDGIAITIEVSNDVNGEPWSVSDAAYKALVQLCADICLRYRITPKFTGDRSGTITAHRMYSATACPGPWLYARLPQLCGDINAELKKSEEAAKMAEYEAKIKALEKRIDELEKELKTIKPLTAQLVEARTINELPKYAREPISAKVGLGTLKGRSPDNLGVSELMARILIIEDRERERQQQQLADALDSITRALTIN